MKADAEASQFIEVAFNLPARKSFSYLPPEEDVCTVGVRVRAPFGSRVLTGYVTGVQTDMPQGDYEIKRIEKVIDDSPLFDDELLELARWTADMYFCSVGEALAAMLPGARSESRLSQEYEREEHIRHTLSGPQKAAVDTITNSTGGVFYLFGVTGSGKTEVFLRAAERTLEEGRGVIYLVPEIALTHQLVQLLAARFGSIVAVIHSKLTPSQKLVEWNRIAGGSARFVVGARSAVFAPIRDLGLIVIDEEHESSYKSGATPRYHARQVAMKRRMMRNARLVMGSATPSVEAHHLMATGRIRRIELSGRLSGGSMPAVSVVDMNGETGPISKMLAQKIRQTCDAGRQVILFLNRRGFSYFFHCRSCGYEMRCRQCSVTMTYHRSDNRMMCHYCGYTASPIETCPECGSLDVGYSGFGTELIEDQIHTLFPDLRAARADTDAVRKKGALAGILQEFHDQKVDILLGTQMVAKGLNFPGVQLVGIVLADTGLHLPDFRAQERTFALIVQVAGRAGRFLPDGEVIVQTYSPGNPAVKLAADGDLDSFYREELSIRKALGFPPFSRLIRIVFRGKNPAKVRKLAESYADRLARTITGEDTLLGPAECPIGVIAGNHRHQIILRSNSLSAGHRAVARLLRSTVRVSGVYTEIDVDPVSLL